MKVAVLFSGQLRGDYHRTINQIRSVMPDDFDFYFGTWSDQNEEKVNQPFIDKVYDYPEFRYNAAQYTIDQATEAYEKLKKAGFANKALNARLLEEGKSPEEIEKNLRGSIDNLKQKGFSNFQHIAHAYMVRDFCPPGKYDIIIRCRYDVYVYSELKAHIKEFCQHVLEFQAPYGFYCYNDYNTQAEYITPVKSLKQSISKDVHDYMIIHRADLFDPNLVIYLYDNAALRQAEAGWYQILCYPYNLFSARVKGYVRMGLQHDDQQVEFDRYRQDPKNKKLKYTNVETMGIIVDDMNEPIKVLAN